MKISEYNTAKGNTVKRRTSIIVASHKDYDALFNYNNDIKVITPYLNNIESRYLKAFGNEKNIKSFLTNYIDWIVWEYIESTVDTADIACAIIDELEKLTSPNEKDRGFVLNLIIELLTDYI